jgi:hypothetical protein
MTRGVVVALLLLAVACGREVTVAPPSELERACSDQATAQCEKEHECLYRGTPGDSASLSACIRALSTHCLRRSNSEGLNEGVTQVATCTRNLRHLSCDDFASLNWPGCFVPGTKLDGEACLWGDQCESYFCNIPNFAQGNHCGLCVSLPGNGEPCRVGCEGGNLPAGLACVPDSTGLSRCTPYGKEGDSCETVPCETTFICVFDEASGRSTCRVPSAGPGEPCDSTVGPFCDTRRGLLACDGRTGNCVPPVLVGEGKECGPRSDGTFADCADPTSCTRNPRTEVGVCVSFIPDGSTCPVSPQSAPPNSAGFCEFPAICEHVAGASTGTCRIVGTDYCQ